MLPSLKVNTVDRRRREQYPRRGGRATQRHRRLRRQISRGAIPAKITDAYNGDFNTIKIHLNNCIDNINAL